MDDTLDISPSKDSYALFIAFNDAAAWPSPIVTHPRRCLSREKSLIVFPPPDDPAAWIATRTTAGQWPVSVRLTAVGLCLSDVFFDCVYERPTLIFLLTLSVVTVEEEGQTRSFAVFGRGIPIPTKWHPDPSPRPSKYPPTIVPQFSQNKSEGHDGDDGHDGHDGPVDTGYDDWLGKHPRVRAVLEREQQRVFERYRDGKPENMVPAHPSWGQMAYIDSVINVGCCDMGYQGFTDTRMLCIRAPKDPERSESDDDDRDRIRQYDSDSTD